MGTLQTQNVRNKSKPVIMEMDKYMYEMEKEAIGMKLDRNLLLIFIDIFFFKTIDIFTYFRTI